MVVLIIIFLVVFLPIIIKYILQASLAHQIEKARDIVYSDNEMINNYSKNVIISDKEREDLLCWSYDRRVKNKTEFKENFGKLANDIYDSDRAGDKYTVNLLSKYMVKYYTEPILMYGNALEKRALRNATMLLSANGYIDKSERDI